MQRKDTVRERQALEILMQVDDSPQKPRYKANHTEPDFQSRGRGGVVRMGKENRGAVLPKLKNSKQELKLILRKLQ